MKKGSGRFFFESAYRKRKIREPAISGFFLAVGNITWKIGDWVQEKSDISEKYRIKH